MNDNDKIMALSELTLLNERLAGDDGEYLYVSPNNSKEYCIKVNEKLDNLRSLRLLTFTMRTLAQDLANNVLDKMGEE